MVDPVWPKKAKELAREFISKEFPGRSNAGPILFPPREKSNQSTKGWVSFTKTKKILKEWARVNQNEKMRVRIGATLLA